MNNAAPLPDARLRDLIDRWEDLHAQGRAPALDELCRESPELLPQLREWIAALQGTAWLERPASIPEPAKEPPPDKVRGRVLGDYIILEKIGAGGMGQVFKARHQHMQRVVAIKVLPPKIGKDPTAVQRFHREARAAARLDHPHIVAAFDAGQANGLHFLVMQYIAGRDLSSLVRADGPFTVERAVDATLQAARGLAYAHAQGIVHRDIKPANLLLDDRGVVRVLDMGLARLEEPTEGQPGLTHSGQVMGTVDYMAPEQARETRHADARADIYSLGCTLHWLLTGETVYVGETIIERLMAHQDQPVPSLRERRADVPEALDAVFQRMLAKQPEDRFPSMQEVITALETEALPPKKRRLGLAAASVASVLLLLVALVWLGVTSRKAPAAKTRAIAPALAEAPFNAAQARDHQQAWARYLNVPVVHENSLGMKLVLIPPGDFIQGASSAEIDPLIADAQDKRFLAVTMSQTPPHRVRISRPFRLAATEVTVGQFRAFVQATQYKTDAERGEGGSAQIDGVATRSPDLNWSHPGHAQSEDCPVMEVSWNDAVEFCNWLSRHERLAPVYQADAEGNWTILKEPGYRLPTDSQWEFGCRAGATTVFPWGNGAEDAGLHAWHRGNSNAASQPVGRKLANAFGLFDMQGNAREWVADWFSNGYYAESPPEDPSGPDSGNRRLIRGGGWSLNETFCRSAVRGRMLPDFATAITGFRIARDL